MALQAAASNYRTDDTNRTKARRANVSLWEREREREAEISFLLSALALETRVQWYAENFVSEFAIYICAGEFGV